MRVLFDHLATSFTKKKVNNDPQEYLFQWGEISYAEFQ